MKKFTITDLKTTIHNYMTVKFNNDISEYGVHESKYYYNYWWLVKKEDKLCKIELFYDKCEPNYWCVSQKQVDKLGNMIGHSAKNIEFEIDHLTYVSVNFPVFNDAFMRRLYEEICDLYDKEENEE